MKKLKSFRIFVSAVLALLGLTSWIGYSYFAFVRQEQLNTDLLTSLRMGQIEVAKSLLEEGADPNSRDMSHVKPEALLLQIWHLLTHSYSPEVERAPTALSCATDFSVVDLTHDNSVPTILVKLLLNRGASIKTDMKCENPALFSATMSGDVPTVQVLLDHGADPNAHNSHGLTALQTAHMETTPSMVHVFLEHGARNINLININ